MSKSYWLNDQKGIFSKKGEDTFDPEKRYIGIRLKQGVPLLDRDWNELEDIRRYEELMLRRWYVGNGTPDDGFRISVDEPPANDFRIAAGRCIVDGFEAVNDPENEGDFLFTLDAGFENDLNNEGFVSEELKAEFEAKRYPLPYNARIRKRKENEWVIADTEKFIVKKEEELKVYEVAKYILYSKQQKDVAALNPPSDGVREDTVYLDVWIEEVTSAEDPALENSKDVNIETCVRHKLEWRVRVDEGSKVYETYHHYYDIAKITREAGRDTILDTDIEDLRRTGLALHHFIEDLRRTGVTVHHLKEANESLTNNSIADALHRHSKLVGKDGSPDPALSVDNDGNVGIGTANPTRKLEVAGTIYGESDSYIGVYGKSSSGNPGVLGEHSTTGDYGALGSVGPNAGVYGKSTDGYAGYFFGRGYFSDNVGIGTVNPARKLHVNDVMRLEPRSRAPSSPSEGDIYMNGNIHKLMVYDGTTWQACW